MRRMELQVVTIAVRSLEKSKKFYEDILGFEPDMYYEPTRWQSYQLNGNGGFGITETPNLVRTTTADIINFKVRVKDQVDVEAELATTPWGTYKFVIRDPDGFRLGFVGQPAV